MIIFKKYMFPQFEHAARKLWLKLDQVPYDEVMKMMYDVVMGELADLQNLYRRYDKSDGDQFDYSLLMKDIKMSLIYAPELEDF